MKPTAPLLLLASTLALAQDLSTIPKCALSCISSAVTKGTACTTTDFACICANLEAITSAATSCVLDACGLDTALNKVLPATKDLCASLPAAPAPAPAPPAVSSPAPAPPAVSSKPAASGPAVPVPTVPAEDCDETPASTTLKTSVVVPVPTKEPVSSEVPVVVKPSATVPAKPPVVTAGAATFGASLGMLVVAGVVGVL